MPHEIGRKTEWPSQDQHPGRQSLTPSQALPALPRATWYEDLDPKDLEYLDHLLSAGVPDAVLGASVSDPAGKATSKRDFKSVSY
ncbi:unnamed protein product [Phytophthora lilii]|uniref:Unnamed protein product n=1 Tax=Phytophthora lilii TaxID=2077276 RepID=A0A9W6TFT3_9STRA|nr:unnamed protein product [Phytophthora lilii]